MIIGTSAKTYCVRHKTNPRLPLKASEELYMHDYLVLNSLIDLVIHNLCQSVAD